MRYHISQCKVNQTNKRHQKFIKIKTGQSHFQLLEFQVNKI